MSAEDSRHVGGGADKESACSRQRQFYQLSAILNFEWRRLKPEREGFLGVLDSLCLCVASRRAPWQLRKDRRKALSLGIMLNQEAEFHASRT